MRRMNYDRFEKPYSFGEYHSDNFRFVLDKALEDGFYIVVLNDEGGGWISSDLMCVKSGDLESIILLHSDDQNKYVRFVYDGTIYLKDVDGNQADSPMAYDGNIVEIYKIN